MNKVKHWIKYFFSGLIYRKQKSVSKRNAMLKWLQQVTASPINALSDASYDVFTYHGEDGMILCLVNKLTGLPPVFVDIGAGDCIKSNCANLAVHFGWSGVFIDSNAQQLAIGKRFYKTILKKGKSLQFIQQQVTTGNINEILLRSGVKKVGLLSIDIDGNDYWIWEAIAVINPMIVVIEAKVEFGFRNIIVPYGEQNHPSVNKRYNGASVVAFRELALSKGYKLVGANKQGYNLFFVRENEYIKVMSPDDILQDPEIQKSFYPESFFGEYKFITQKN